MSLPPTEADICNAALGHVEHTFRIASLQDGSPEAESCRFHFDAVRRQVLKDLTLHFATEFLSLDATLANVVTPEDYPYVYQLRPDVLKVQKIEGVTRQKFLVLGKTNRLHTVYPPPIVVRVTLDVTDITRFEPEAVTAMEMLMASRIAPRWSKSQNRSEIWAKRYADHIERAEVTEGTEGGDGLYDDAAELDWRLAVPGGPYPWNESW